MNEEDVQDAVPEASNGRLPRLGATDYVFVAGMACALGPDVVCGTAGLPTGGTVASVVQGAGVVLAFNAIASARASARRRKVEGKR